MSHDLDTSTWLEQATRDLEAAEHLLQKDFPAHATVFAHLAVEKGLKGVFRRRTGEHPPVTHNLRHLAGRLDLSWMQDQQNALESLSDVSILSLYEPDAPFGHPVSEKTIPARERVANARMLLGWLLENSAADNARDDD